MPFLDLPDCVNARDLGGTPLAGGATIRMRALLRSDNHDLLTEAGIDAVRELGVVRILDLRHGWEAREFPSPFAEEEIYRNLPLLGVYPGFDPTAPDDYRPEVDNAPNASPPRSPPSPMHPRGRCWCTATRAATAPAS